MTDCRSHGLGDCPQHATSGIGLLRRQYDEMVSENARLTALLAERDAEIVRLVEAATALTAKTPCFVTIRPGGNDIECCQFCLTNNAHAPGCEWVGLRAALAARGGEDSPT